MKRLLFIGAHPDDETFFAAGTFARYRSQGVPVSLVCATRGQAGKTGGFCTAEELPQVRERELQNAMKVLGVDDLQLLAYQDKQLADAPPAEIVGHLVRAIRRIRPSVVITFDPQGANQHPDHIAISRFANDAVAAAADARWYPETGEPHRVDRVLWTPPKFIFHTDPHAAFRDEPGFDFVLDVSRWHAQKRAAFEAHRTQFPGLRKLFIDDPNGQRTFGTEAFRLAYGVRPKQHPADDLFVDLPD